jgi:hypothetical protein
VPLFYFRTCHIGAKKFFCRSFFAISDDRLIGSNLLRFWLNLQGSYDLETAEDESSDRIEHEVLPAARREFSLT